MRVERVEEFQIEPPIHRAIHELLRRSFPEYPAERSFLKQLPDFRFLAWAEDRLIAHLAVEHRLICNNGKLLRIFGIADLCVDPDFQHRRIGTRLVLELETLGQINGIEFLVLLAKEHEFYKNNGFELVDNDCKWMIIQHNGTLGIAHRKIYDSLMVKALGAKTWESGLVDFLGHIF